jgi:hypothetical protein
MTSASIVGQTLPRIASATAPFASGRSGGKILCFAHP